MKWFAYGLLVFVASTTLVWCHPTGGACTSVSNGQQVCVDYSRERASDEISTACRASGGTFSEECPTGGTGSCPGRDTSITQVVYYPPLTAEAVRAICIATSH